MGKMCIRQSGWKINGGITVKESDLKAALFEIFSAGFIACMEGKTLAAAYNEYWEYLES